MRFAAPLSLVTFALCSSAAFADDETPPVVGGKTYTQHQILAAKARFPEILSITAIGKRPDDKQFVVLGSTESARAAMVRARSQSFSETGVSVVR